MGGRAVGFDIEHLPHHGPVPPGADLVLQDVLTLHGAQFKDAASASTAAGAVSRRHRSKRRKSRYTLIPGATVAKPRI